jgi:ribosome-binding factor A
MPQRYRRSDRINRLLQNEISEIIRMDLKDPRIGFTSVVRVETTGDLRHARVRVSVMGTDIEKKETLDGLSRSAHYIRDTLLRRLSIKRVPQLEFILDENIEYSINMSRLIDDLKRP